MCFAGQTLRELTQMLKKNISIVLFILGVSLLTGCCFHGSYPPMLPSTWNGNEYDAKSLEDNSEQSKLHVMVMYHKTSCKHTALRLYCRTKGPLFWDPAGVLLPLKYVIWVRRHAITGTLQPNAIWIRNVGMM